MISDETFMVMGGALASLIALWLVFRKIPCEKLGVDFGGAFRGGTHEVSPPWVADPAPSQPPRPLPPYDPLATCAKCGSAEADSTYRDYSQDFKFLPPVPGPNRRRWSWEHMERRCRGCGYVWAEAPRNHDPSGGAS